MASLKNSFARYGQLDKYVKTARHIFMSIYNYPVVNIIGATGPAGGTICPTRLVTSASATIASSDYYVGVNTASPVFLTLPAGQEGLNIVVKDESGAAGSNNITILCQTGEKIEGVVDGTKLVNSNYGSLRFIYHAGWWVI